MYCNDHFLVIYFFFILSGLSRIDLFCNCYALRVYFYVISFFTKPVKNDSASFLIPPLAEESILKELFLILFLWSLSGVSTIGNTCEGFIFSPCSEE